MIGVAMSTFSASGWQKSKNCQAADLIQSIQGVAPDSRFVPPDGPVVE